MKKLSVLTAYDFNTARALAETGIDYILVGDSLAMVALGHETTRDVSVEEMLIFTAAVCRGAGSVPVIADIPWASVIKEKEQIIADVYKFLDAGASMVKIENAEAKTLELIKDLVANSVKVCAHIGYTPQDLEKFAGKSKLVRDEERLLAEAKELEKAGAELLVLEMIPADIAKKITEAISIPTIGIGAGAHCSGQVLVSDDLLGRYNLMKPKFLRRQAEQYQDMLQAFKAYKDSVEKGDFPSEAESFS